MSGETLRRDALAEILRVHRWTQGGPAGYGPRCMCGHWRGLRSEHPSHLAAVLAPLVAAVGSGDTFDVEAGRCCPHCRQLLTEHNRAVWEAGYSVGQRHMLGAAR